jgi:hypothetical protein
MEEMEEDESKTKQSAGHTRVLLMMPKRLLPFFWEPVRALATNSRSLAVCRSIRRRPPCP